jgi:mannose-6-phosphate isomerase-like protein (cupin superfamily)
MQATRSGIDTKPGPSEWFTGEVYVDSVAAPSGPSRLRASSVHFVTEGVGLAQRRGGPIEVIRPGYRVFFEPGEDHRHGAAPNRFMTHLAMQQVDEQGNAANWGDHVSDEQTGAATNIEEA